MKRAILLPLCLLPLIACAHGDIREEKIGKYHPIVQDAIRNGKIMEGMDFEMVWLAIGDTPCKCWFNYKDMMTEIWGYDWNAEKQRMAWGKDCNRTRLNVIFENGRVIAWDNP